MANPPVFLPGEHHEQYEKVKSCDRLESVKYAIEKECRIISRNNEESDQSRNDVQLWMCLEMEAMSDAVRTICIGSGNINFMNQGKLDVVKQEMARLNIDILGISEVKWTGIGEFNSDDHYIHYCQQ